MGSSIPTLDDIIARLVLISASKTSITNTIVPLVADSSALLSQTGERGNYGG